MIDFQEVTDSVKEGVTALLEKAGLSPGDLFVLGCSTSEVMGERIGTGSSFEAAEAIFKGLFPLLKERGIYLAVQCCEHLNRCIVLEKEAMKAYGLEEVTVVPHPHAGGSAASFCYEHLMEHPVVVETVKAHAGMDIGQTLIGMHLKPVAVPVRTGVKMIGNAVVTFARTRPKLVGGERAQYPHGIR